MRLLPLTASLAVLAALPATLTPADARPRDRAAEAGLTPIPGAKPENCIRIVAIRESRVRDDRTIDFYTTGGRIYRNTLPNSCPQLGFEQSFTYTTSLQQLCSVDIITVLNRTGGDLARGASCGLGDFTPMTKMAKAK